MNSMTGFGRGKAALGHGQLALEIKTVNHRFLEIRSRTPNELSGIELIVEKLTRAALTRGHCTIHVTFENLISSASTLNVAALNAHLAALAPVARQHELSMAELIPLIAHAPDLFCATTFSDVDAVEKATGIAFEEALGKLLAMRRAEGAAMSVEICARLDNISTAVSQIRKSADNYAGAIMERTKTRLHLLLREVSAELDRGRLESEIAILADKADINEELTRLESHVQQMKALADTDKPAGRRMEFLIQEMGREANTIGAKSASAEITHLIVTFKGDLERIRELVQNVE